MIILELLQSRELNAETADKRKSLGYPFGRRIYSIVVKLYDETIVYVLIFRAACIILVHSSSFFD
jgi:hypothetical protein